MTPTRRCFTIHPAFFGCMLVAVATGCLEESPPAEDVPEGEGSVSTPARDLLDEPGQTQTDSPALAGSRPPSSSGASAGAAGAASATSTPKPAAAPAAAQPATPSDDHDSGPITYALAPDPLADFPSGAEQLARVCGRGRNDIVVRALCSNPKIDSIPALQAALGLAFVDRTEEAGNGGDGNPSFSLLGHSTSLVGHHVSAINPRAFIFTPLLQRFNGFVVMSFVRGSPFIELAAQDSTTSKLSFYLLKFGLACEETGKCTNADLLTPAIERDWRGTTLYDDEDLKNTVVDCRQCHQPDGPATNPMLRMQELQIPWTHWFSDSLEGGFALLQDFQRAHAQSEDYAGIPGPILSEGDGFTMATFVIGQGYSVQPNEFQSLLIETEVKASAQQQPTVNTPKGTSGTWKQIYDAAATGRFIPPPYHDVKVTDPMKLAKATASYSDFMAGRLDADALVDIRDVFLDAALADMNFSAPDNASGRQVLIQACSQCHNSRLDQTLSRARFDVTRLDEMSADVKALARSRLLLPTSDIKHMPPVMFRTLSENALQRALDELSR